MLWNESQTGVAGPLDPSNGNGLHAFLAFACAAGVPRRTTRALQLGCGSGELSDVLASRFAEYIGIDPDALAVRRAKRRSIGQRSNVRFFVGDDVQPDDLHGDSFDLVLCDFNRIPAGRDVLGRMGSLIRLLAPGGIALFDVPRRRSLVAALRDPGARHGSVSISWPDAANEARLARARIMWVDKARPGGTLYCIARGS
jgi:SAM-dependent methyltransferase